MPAPSNTEKKQQQQEAEQQKRKKKAVIAVEQLGQRTKTIKAGARHSWHTHTHSQCMSCMQKQVWIPQQMRPTAVPSVYWST